MDQSPISDEGSYVHYLDAREAIARRTANQGRIHENKTFFRQLLAATSAAIVILSCSPAHAADGLLEGAVVTREGNNVIVRTEKGDVPLTVNEQTYIGENQGLLFFLTDTSKKDDLIPGLYIKAETMTDGKQTIAKVIRYSIGDMRRATEIQAALAVPLKEAAALRERVKVQEQTIVALQKQLEVRKAEVDKRFADLGDYDIKQELVIQFDVNSTKLSDQARKDLEALAERAKTFRGYLIQVAGYTDADGSASSNQALSDRRAASVVNYLRQSCDIALSRVLSAVAMSEARPVATNETAQGKAENRRVTVKLGVNRGISP